MGIRLRELIERLGGQLIGDAEIEVTGIAPVDQARADHITFLSNPKFRQQAAATEAAALILSEADNALIGADYRGARIIAANPYVYFARAAQWFAELATPPVFAGVHASAVVDPSAQIACDAQVGPLVVVGANVIIGAAAVIGAGSVIGRDAQVGAHSVFHPRVSLLDGCIVGERCLVHSGAVIGADGFGFANERGVWVKIPQVGRVVIGNDVEIGANTTIDRGALADTVIEDGVKLDNQIQIAHNCRIGAHTAMAACVGIAGSATIGSYCTIGGAAMIAGHLTIADRTHVSSGTLVSRSIHKAGAYTGFYPFDDHASWEKSAATVRNLPTMREKIRALEKIVRSFAPAKSDAASDHPSDNKNE